MSQVRVQLKANSSSFHPALKKLVGENVISECVDTDVILIAISVFKDTEADEIWIAFATGKHFRYNPIHDIAQSLGPLKSRILPTFNAFTGCDTVSSFAGRGKKTAWDTWNAFPEVSAAFRHMTDQPSRSIESVPPTREALYQHAKRSVYQAGLIWMQRLLLRPVLPSPDLYVWKNQDNGMWYPFLTILAKAASPLQELVHCGCKKVCRGQCKCFKSALPCTALCKCGGDCA
ncbi:unnamed protein product [Mytilus coruscus]|uniref:Tesmin/TSO1-like CXC domain-containing protein n=1 Tax=Mytilus coruscus TaxID=42192 RepID=A0A6J8BQE0_MYTCO|nr:unnamed protein product [Mytilus coruscus]